MQEKNLLDLEIEVRENKAFTQYVGAFVGIMVVIIIAVAVVIPTVTDVINNANLTGTTAVVLGIVPLLIGVAVVLLVVGLMR